MRNLAKVPADPWPEFKVRVIWCPRERSWADWQPAPAPATPISCRARSSVSRTISRLPSRTCGCRSRTAASFAPQTPRTVVRRTATKAKNRSQRFGQKPVLKLILGTLTRVAERCEVRGSLSSTCGRSPPSKRTSTRNIRLPHVAGSARSVLAFPANPYLDLAERWSLDNAARVTGTAHYVSPVTSSRLIRPSFSASRRSGRTHLVVCKPKH